MIRYRKLFLSIYKTIPLGAIKNIFPKTEIQLCIVHQIRNSLKYIGSNYKKEFLNDLKEVYKAPTLELAEANLDSLAGKWGDNDSITKAPEGFKHKIFHSAQFDVYV